MAARRPDPQTWIAELRRRGQLLTGVRPDTPEAVVRQLTAVQAQEHNYARWSIASRLAGCPSASAIDADFDAGRFLRTHVLRPTWHYVAPADLRWLIRLSGPRVLAANAGRCRDLGLDGASLGRANELIAGAVEAAPQTRSELAARLTGGGISAEGQRLAYLLMHAELTAVICSGPVRGTQPTYTAFDQRVPHQPDRDEEEALAELAGRYFTTRGPATLRDFTWWSGLRAGEARSALESIRPELETRLVDGRTYWFAPDPGPGPRSSRDSVDLVPRYDEIIIAYTESRDVLQTAAVAFAPPVHIDGFHHVVLSGGRLLGHWRADRRRAGLAVTVKAWRPLAGRAEEQALARAVAAFARFEAGPQQG